MNRIELEDYIKVSYGAEPEHLWIYSLARKNSKDIYAIVSSYCESVAKLSKQE